jgi:hypothetical protein
LTYKAFCDLASPFLPLVFFFTNPALPIELLVIPLNICFLLANDASRLNSNVTSSLEYFSDPSSQHITLISSYHVPGSVMGTEDRMERDTDTVLV